MDMTSTCAELKAQLSDYIDGELEAGLCAELERHLAGCDNCRIVVNGAHVEHWLNGKKILVLAEKIQQIGEIVAEWLITALVNTGRFEVVERAQLQKILRRHSLRRRLTLR